MDNEMKFEVTLLSGESRGTVTARRSGLVTAFEYIGPMCTSPMRLLMLRPAGALSVGIPAPRDGEAYLYRRLSRAAMGGADLTGEIKFVLTDVSEDYSALSLKSSEPVPKEAPPETPPETEPEPEPEAAPVMEPAHTEEPAPAPEPEEEPAPEPEDKPAPPVPGEWAPEPDPGRHFEDPVLRECSAGAADVLCRREGGDTLLAFPYSPSKPFPLIPAFRLGAAAVINRADYIVFRVREGRVV